MKKRIAKKIVKNKETLKYSTGQIETAQQRTAKIKPKKSDQSKAAKA